MKTVVLDVVEARVLYADSLEYDHALASYGTRGGVLPTEHPTERHTSPTMLIDALDGAFARLGDSGIETARVGAVKIDAMQHCTVYAAGS